MNLRTIDETFRIVMEMDPGTALTKTALRRLVVTGQLPSVRIGSKYLINLDVLENFLRGGARDA